MQQILFGASPRMSPDGSPCPETTSGPSLAGLSAARVPFCRQGEDGEMLVLLLDPLELPRGECWTLNISACPSEGAVSSSLRDVLEAGPIPSKYFLSARACAGILRRAAR